MPTYLELLQRRTPTQPPPAPTPTPSPAIPWRETHYYGWRAREQAAPVVRPTTWTPISTDTGGVSQIIRETVAQAEATYPPYTPPAAPPPPAPEPVSPAREPVPATWGQWATQWVGRQAEAISDWWQGAEQEVWTEKPPTTPWEAMTEEADRLVTLGEEAAAEFREKPSLGTALNLGLRSAGILTGIVKVPFAGARQIPGLPGKTFTALEQATQGVTGAIVGGFDVIDSAIEQGLFGVGAEIVTPMLLGTQGDFTPQEFEAGRTRYTRWWKAASTYAGELWDGRVKKGLSLVEADKRATAKVTAAVPEIHEQTMAAIRNGATPEDLEADATLTNPWAELAGRLVLDPLNLIPAAAGRRARMGNSKETAAKLWAMEDLTDYNRMADTMKAEGARGPIWRTLHPLRKNNASLAGQWSERTALTLANALEGATDPGDVAQIVRAFTFAGGGDDAAIAAQQFLKQRFGALPLSKAGKQTTLLLREIATDPKTGKFAIANVEDWFKAAKSDQDIIKQMLGGLDDALQRVYPVKDPNIVRKAQNYYRTILSRYMYMGWNPGYALRNAASNTSLSLISGYRPFEGAGVLQEFAQRWGTGVFELRKGYGGPGGEYLGLQVQDALKSLGKEYDAVRLRDLPESVIKELSERGLKGAPFMRLSEVAETASGERIIKQALGHFWKQYWKPVIPDEVRRLFPSSEQAKALERMLGDAVSPTEMYGALEASVLGRNLPDELLQRMDDLPTELRREIMRAHLEATDANDFASRVQGISNQVDDWLTKTMDDLAPEIAVNDELVKGATRAERQILEDIEDAEEATEVADILKVDDFEKQLAGDRARDMAAGELLARHVQANPDDGPIITRLFATHQQEGPSTAARVDTARARAWAASDATPGGKLGRKERNRIWSEYFTYRNAEWRRHWDDFATKADEFLAGRRRGEQMVFPGMEEAISPDTQAEMEELAKEFLETLTPTRQAVAHISAADARQVLQDLGEAGQGLNWGAMPPLGDEATETITRWLDDILQPQMHETKALANQVALAERDFVLYNYQDRRHIDNALSYLYPYHYWYSRSAVNIPRMLLYNPKVLEGYLDYKEAVGQANKEAQGLPWWEQQIKIPGTEYYVNLEATLNPLYSMINDFHDPDKTKTPPGEWLEKLGDIGPSIDTIYWAAYAVWRFKQGKPEEALAAMGYMGQPSRAFRYATAALGAAEGRGITLEPWLWDDPLSFTGLDKWERRRVGYHLHQLVGEGAITEEQAWDAGYKQGGDIWNQAVARMTDERSLGTFLSWALGIGLKPRKAYEVQVQKALNAQYEFYAHADTAYDMSTDEGQAAYKEAQRALYRYYPFLSYVLLTRRGELERDKAYAWQVLNRVPPGSPGYAVKEAAGIMDDATINLFYETMGDFEGWSDIDRAKFMSSIEAMGGILGVPDKPRRDEWDRAINIYREVKAALRRLYGDDIWDLNDSYWNYREVAGADAAKAFAEGNPQLAEFWKYRDLAISESPALMSYWGTLDTLDRVAENLLEEEVLSRWPDYKEIQDLYFKPFDKDDWKAEREYRRNHLKQYPWLTDVWDFKDDMREELAIVVEQQAKEMKPPLGPVLRPDTDLGSVLIQRIQEIIEAKYETEEWIRGPRAIGYPVGGAEATLAGEVEAEAVLDSKQPSVVSYKVSGTTPPRGVAAEGGAAAGVERTEPSTPVAPPEEVPPEEALPETPEEAPPAERPETLSWGYIRGQLKQSIFGLIQHFNTGLPLSEPLSARLEEIFAEYPLGFADLASWLGFVKTLWRASLFRSGGTYGVSGLAKRPAPLAWGSTSVGAGRRFTPWG